MNYVILASGSRGNCTILSNKDHFLMIDCGIPKRELYDKLFSLKLTLKEIEAVLITHEHIDHIRSIKEVAHNKLYGRDKTLDFDKQNILEPYNTYKIAGFNILVIPTSHDCKSPCGYVISDEKERMVYITDTGYIKEKDFQYLQNAEHYVFESNYDPEMLFSSKRPNFLKDRINGMKGHLSNEISANILTKLVGDKTKTIRLAHVSEDCNSHELALKALVNAFDELDVDYSKIDIQVADRYNITKGEVGHEII